MLPLILTLAVLDPPTPRAQFDALKAEYDAREADWNRRYSPGDAKPGEERVDWAARYRDYPAWDYAPRFLALAEAHPGDPAAADALFWVADLIGSVGDRDRELAGTQARALELIAKSHVDDARVDDLGRTVAFSGGTPTSAAFLRDVAARAASRDVRGRAGLAYARSLVGRRELALRPWFDRAEGRSPHEALLIGRLDPAYVAAARAADPADLLVEAEAEFDRLIAEYGDVRADPRPGREESIGQVVVRERFEALHLGVGQVAPEVEGADADGVPFKLSDYRGKVVVLTFSGDWCGPCVAMYPGERALVERYKGKPFAILSVNTDDDRETLRREIAAGDVTWRCWWDGGTDGPITTAWNTRSFPTVYLLDGAGVIRAKHLRAEALDAAVARLMEEPPARP